MLAKVRKRSMKMNRFGNDTGPPQYIHDCLLHGVYRKCDFGAMIITGMQSLACNGGIMTCGRKGGVVAA